MAFYTTYYDTSGNVGRAEQGQVMVTAGMVASEKQWLGFDKEWREELTKARIPYLHMKEMVRLFRKREDDQWPFLMRAIRILRKRATRCFSVTLVLSDYELINREFMLEEAVNGPFGLCAGSCAYLADRWFKKTVGDHPLEHYHEHGDSHIAEAQAFARRQDIVLNTKKALDHNEYFRPFEATDFIAWENRGGYEHAIAQVPENFRASFETLILTLKTERGNLDRDYLRRMCLKQQILRRR